jgi:hypothetical protein
MIIPRSAPNAPQAKGILEMQINNTVLGNIFFVNFNQTTNREVKREYLNFLMDLQAIDVCEFTSRSHVFFIPLNSEPTTKLFKFMKENEMTFMKMTVQNSDENKTMLKEKAKAEILARFEALKKIADKKIKTTLRPSVIRRQIKAFYQLKEMAETYSKLTNFTTTNFEKHIESNVVNLTNELKKMQFVPA